MAGRETNATLRLYFNYVPVGIITALIIKQVLVSTSGQLSISFPVLIGCLSTAIIIRIVKMFLPSVVVGVIMGLLVRYYLIS